MKQIAIYLTLSLLLASHGHACLWNSQPNTELYEVFNHFFFKPGGKDVFSSNAELFASPYFPNDSMQTAWWGGPEDVFSVESIYSRSLLSRKPGSLENSVYHELTIAGTIYRSSYFQPEGAALQMKREVGFMWTGSSLWGNEPYSDPLYNSGDSDLFVAFAITDKDMLSYYYKGEHSASDDELYLVAFDGLDFCGGNSGDLVTVVSCKPSDVMAAPLPTSVFMLAGGCTGLAYLRIRQKTQQRRRHNSLTS